MIAERARVAVGTVYNHFVDKRALILELLAETDREQADPVVAGLDPATWRGRHDPREITRALIDAIFRGQSRQPGIQRILWARYFKDPDFEKPFEAVRARIRRAIVEFIDAVDEQGLLRPGVDREMAPFVILNAVQWNATQAFFQGSPALLDAAAAATAEMVALYLFREPGGRGRPIRRGAAGARADAGRARPDRVRRSRRG